MTSYNIGDLVTRDKKAEFRNDVQLSSYNNEQANESLVSSYLFTTDAPAGTVSSATVLFTAMQCFLNERLENRLVVIANFGHGKSHLALAMANYFGRSAGSAAFRTVLEKINKAFSGAASAKTYEQFKDGHGEFLVVRLRGDVPGSLREQFLSNMEQSLSEHKVSKGHRLPGWYEKAEEYLGDLKGASLKKANAFLEQYELDVPMLLQHVERKQDSAYDHFVKLFAHLDEHGFQPNMGGELSLSHTIEWSVREFCGDSKLGGVVVLFDEFSLYVEKYAQRSAAGDLQDLLNGIENCKGKAVFLAFAQQDPITVAQNALANSSANQRDSLLKELTRIPKKLILHSLMESVIDSYLDQPNGKWQAFSQDPTASLQISQATDIALEQFKERYTTLGWTSLQKFQEIITKGCFPLHPITTALLCNMQFQQSVSASGAPRNILGFILEQLDRLGEQPAIVGKRINWVLPTYLVDYFGERLPADRYRAYRQALEHLSGDNEDAIFSLEDQADILKAILLQQVAGLKARDEDQIELIASMVGWPQSDAKKCLRMLSDTRVIAWNQDGRKSYSLWASSFNPYKLDQILERKTQGIEITHADLVEFSKQQLGATQVSIPWGHQDDWQAPEFVLTADFFNPKTLRDLVGYYSYDAQHGFCEGDRGCVVWLVARNADEAAALRQTAQKVLDDAFPESEPLPVIVLLPLHENSLLISSMRNIKALAKFTQTEKDESGSEVYQTKLGQENLNLQQAIIGMRNGENYRDVLRFQTQWVVAKPYKAHLQQLGSVSLAKLLEGLYNMSYRYSPPEFFKQYSVNARNFRNIVRAVAGDLLHADAASLSGTTRTSPMAKDLVDALSRGWKMITADNRIRTPGSERILPAWELLDGAFPAGQRENPVRAPLLALLNPPYGYDYNTAVLLFCGWFGYNSHSLQVCADGRVTAPSQLDKWLQSPPRDFLSCLLEEKVALSRRDTAKATKEIQALLIKVKRGGLSQNEAREIEPRLEDFAAHDAGNPELAQAARQEAANIRTGLEMVSQYEAHIQKAIDAMEHERDIQKLGALLESLGTVPEPTLIQPNVPSINEVRTLLREWLEKIVGEDCEEYENIRDLTNLGLYRRQLEDLRKQLSRLHLSDLADQAKASLVRLEKNAQGLQTSQNEAIIQAQIQRMSTSAPLDDLLKFRSELKELEGLSKETGKIRDAQLRALAAEIERIEGLVEGGQDELAAVGKKSELDEWRRQLEALTPRLEGTTLAKKLPKLLSEGEALGEFFDELWKIDNYWIRTEEDATEVRKQLQAIGKKFAKSIGPKQQKAIEVAASKVEKRVHELEEQAVAFLTEMEKSLAEGAKAAELHAGLEHPIPFLPEKAKKKYQALVERVEKKLDEDVVAQLEVQFRRIKDASVRVQCLKRLTEIMEE